MWTSERGFYIYAMFFIIIGVVWYAVKQILLHLELMLIKAMQNKDFRNLTK